MSKAPAKAHRRQVRRLGYEMMDAALMGKALMQRTDAIDAIQVVIDRTATQLQYVASRVDRLRPGIGRNTTELDREYVTSYDENGNAVVSVSHLIAHEKSLREELFGYVSKAAHLGLAERVVRLREARMALVGQAMKEACIEAGLDEPTQKTLAVALHGALSRAMPIEDDVPVRKELVA